MTFLRNRLSENPNHTKKGVRVLELGSRNINGSPRVFFQQAGYYLGIDCHGGNGVDRVGVVHEVLEGWDGDDFDVVVSTEMFEHDPFWRETLRSSVSLLKPGGILLLSCASKKRAAHHLEDSPIPGHYEGLNPEELIGELEKLQMWETLDGSTQRNDLDTFVFGRVGQ